jgi:hypothetical protein
MLVLFIVGFCLTSFGITSSASAELVGYWPLDDDFNDHSGTFFNNGIAGNLLADDSGSTAGGPQFDVNVPEAIGSGMSARFDGIDDYVDLGNNGGESGSYNLTTNDWTISLWVSESQTNNWVAFANGGNDAGGIRTWLWSSNGETPWLTVDDNGTGTGFGKVEAVGPAELEAGWHHFVGQRKGNETRVYIDGALVATNTLGSGYDLTGITQQNAYLGMGYELEDDKLLRPLNGYIDDVSIFDTALSQRQIRALSRGDYTPLEIESATWQSIASNGFEQLGGELSFSQETSLSAQNDDSAHAEIQAAFANTGEGSLYVGGAITFPSGTTPPNDQTVTVTFDPVDLTNWTDVEVSLSFIANPNSGSLVFEGSDHLTVEVQHDGTGSPIVLFDEDGNVLDGLIGQGYQSLEATIPDDATTATLLLYVTISAGNEPIHFDDILFSGTFLPSLLGDLDGNGVVDRADLAKLASNMGKIGATFGDGDFNDDEIVSLADLAILQAHFGDMSEPAPSPAAVPEPASGALAAVSFLFATLVARRRNRAKA